MVTPRRWPAKQLARSHKVVRMFGIGHISNAVNEVTERSSFRNYGTKQDRYARPINHSIMQFSSVICDWIKI